MMNSWLEHHFAAIAQLVEHDLAKVGVASSSLVCRSNETTERVKDHSGLYCNAQVAEW